MLKRLEYPILYVTDMERSRDFYVDVLGCSVDEDLGDFAELRLGDSRIALNTADDHEKRAGAQTILVSSTDLEADYARIAARATINQTLTLTSYGKTFMFLDPDGNKIEVVDG